jgi:hypothetical protein
MMSGERNGARPCQMMERINTVGMAMSKSRIAFCVFMARPLSEKHFLLQKWCIEVVYAKICLYPILLVLNIYRDTKDSSDRVADDLLTAHTTSVHSLPNSVLIALSALLWSGLAIGYEHAK